MSLTNKDNVQYSALSILSTSAKTLNNNVVTNSNANGTFNNTAGESSSTFINQKFNQIFITI
jgi:hypothetical protein